MSVKSPIVKHTELTGLLAAGRKSYTYVQISGTSTCTSPNRICRICDERGPLCRCENNAEPINNKDDQTSLYRHKFAQSLLLLITFILAVAIIGSDLLLRNFRVPAADHKNPLMMSVFLDNESTSRFEVVDNTVDVVKGRRTKRVLASGTYIRNAEGGGWNHLTVRAGEGFSSSPTNREYSQETSLNYIRSMEAAGYLEGYATCMEMGQYYVNFYFGLFDGGDPTQGSLEFLEDNYDWMASEAEKNWDTSDYWLAVKGILAQLNGLLDGLREGCPSFTHSHSQEFSENDPQHRGGVYLPSLTRSPSLIHLLLLNANGDLYQISDKFSQTDSSPTTDDSDDKVEHPFDPLVPGSSSNPSVFARERRSFSEYSKTHHLFNGKSGNPSNIKMSEEGTIDFKVTKGRKLWGRRRRGRGGEEMTGGSRSEGVDHCSALIKLVSSKGENKNDIIVGHNTWDDFQCAGPRIFKHYSLPLITGFDVPDTISSGYNAGTATSIESNEDSKEPEGSPQTSHSKEPEGSPSTSQGHQSQNCNFMRNARSEMLKKSSLSSSVDIGNVSLDSLEARVEVGRQLEGNAEEIVNMPNGGYEDFDEDDKSDDDNDLKRPDDDDSHSNRNKDRLEMHFSSSPGLLSSVDDFFTLTGRGEFIVLETTMDVYNVELLQYIRPDTMLSWTRARLSNQLASTGAEWAEIFSMYHSGTYANQWMVVDLAQFRSGRDPVHGLLTVLEEIPGYMHSADLTSHLIEHGYWASYNNPYFDDISTLSGNADMCTENSLTCYSTDPRANLFRKHQSTVRTLGDMQRLMGLNEFASDPLSLNDSCNAIACRQDLEPILESRYPFGAIDGKVTSARLLMSAAAFESKRKTVPLEKDISSPTISSRTRSPFSLIATDLSSNRNNIRKMTRSAQDDSILSRASSYRPPHAYARMGPSNRADGMPPFCWKAFSKNRDKRGKIFSHAGQPDCFDFAWQAMPPPLRE